MNVLISGGCKNGKSHYAQELACQMARDQNVPLYYLATMIPCDDEDRARIRRHLADRDGLGFETIEQGRNICACLGEDGRTTEGRAIDPRGVFLLDSVTALLSNEMFSPDGSVDCQATARLSSELADFARQTGNTVFVSDYIYSDAKRFDQYTENYRKGLAMLDRKLASICFQTIEVVYGTKIIYQRPEEM